MFNEEEEEEEEEEFEENEDNYYFRHRFWRMRRQFEQQNNLQTFNNQIPTISAIINLNGVPQQTFSSSSSPSHQFFPQSTNIYPQQFIPPQSPTDSQSIQIQLHNNELTDNNNNNSQYNNEFQRRKRKINNSPQQQQYSPQQLNNPKLEQKRKIHYRTNLVLGAVIICMFFTGICVIITLLRI
uniref:Transmembrane protein n=1 Tax=Meloidogyne hapla TaxID=6305 RepID=A0A1I8B2B9_MELHA